MKLEVGADSIRDLCDYLRHFAFEVEHKGARRGCSGGCSSGALYDISEDESITHESYVRDLEAHIKGSPAPEGRAGE